MDRLMVRKSELAELLAVSPKDFEKLLPRLVEEGFPAADPTLRGWFIKSVEAWLRERAEARGRDPLLAKIPPGPSEVLAAIARYRGSHS